MCAIQLIYQPLTSRINCLELKSSQSIRWSHALESTMSWAYDCPYHRAIIAILLNNKIGVLQSNVHKRIEMTNAVQSRRTWFLKGRVFHEGLVCSLTLESIIPKAVTNNSSSTILQHSFGIFYFYFGPLPDMLEIYILMRDWEWNYLWESTKLCWLKLDTFNVDLICYDMISLVCSNAFNSD